MKQRIILLVSFFLIIIVGYAQNDDLNKIKESLFNQQNAWNKGDIDAYMNTYWNSDSLQFIGKNGIEYGWQTTLNNYKKSFPNAETMGKLTFTIVSLEKLSNQTAFMIGKWQLDRTNPVGGTFTLLWKKINNQWLIIVDHTS